MKVQTLIYYLHCATYRLESAVAVFAGLGEPVAADGGHGRVIVVGDELGSVSQTVVHALVE